VSSLTVESPVGPLTVLAEADAIVSLWFVAADRPGAATPLLRDARRQLKEYFARRRRAFDLPLAPQGTPFQRRVWDALRRIPYGEQRSYGEIAKALRSSPRAVGQACGQNPIPIIIPCHRVVGGQSLGGYSGGKGVATKKRLLELERIDLFSALPG
jgi:methylated-DNA-[protein]-cysteine S-methyltransferase